MIKYILLFIAYFLLPRIITDMSFYIFLLLILFPAICFILALFSGMKYGFEMLFPFMCAIIFIPFIYIYFNDSAYIYCVLYAISGFLGSGLGGLLKGKFMKT